MIEQTNNNLVEQGVFSQNIKEVSSVKVISLAVLVVVVLGIGAFFSVSYMLKKINTSEQEKNINVSRNTTKDSNYSSTSIEGLVNGYLEALSSGNYEKAYSFLSEELTPVNKEDWVKYNKEASYKVVSYYLPSGFSVDENNFSMSGNYKIYKLDFDMKTKSNFASEMNSYSTLSLVVSKNNDQKLVDRGSFIASKTLNKSVLNTVGTDSVKSVFTLKKALFTQNMVFLTWDYSDGGPLKNNNVMISASRSPILINVADGNSIKFINGKINSKELFTSFDRKTGLVSKNNFSAFSLGRDSDTDFSIVWDLSNLNLKFTTPIYSSSLSGKALFPEITIN